MSERTQRSVTIAVTETQSGQRIVSSSEGALRPGVRQAMEPGEIAANGQRSVHAEINGLNSAEALGLKPTGVAASRPICSDCADAMAGRGVASLSQVKR